MNSKKRSLSILQACIDQLDHMSKEQIESRLKEKGLDKYVCNDEESDNDVFMLATVLDPNGISCYSSSVNKIISTNNLGLAS